MSYSSVMEAVRHTVDRAGRGPEEITVVAISKGQTLDAVRSAYDVGHRDFGENRAHDLVAKAAELPADIRWHFVGALQTNKARSVRPVASLLHSMDREALAAAWVKGSGRPPPVLIQVNLGEEPQKAGVSETGLEALVSECIDLGLEVRGLMAIPPAPERPEDSRPWFRRLREIAAEMSRIYPIGRELSMGMTDDFEVAIEEGATMIRVGRAIFGPRR